MNVVFFGTPAFAAKTLQFLLDHHVNVAAVITKPDRPKGRSSTPIPTPVKQVAQSANLPYFQPEKVSAPEFAPTLTQFAADLFVVVAYGEILKQHILDMPKIGCINLHASLLPKYRGAAPIQRAIMDGEMTTGVTIMHMVRQMDAGEIIQTVTIPIDPDAQFPEIENELCEKGSQALLEVIRAFEKGSVPCTPQDHTKATHAAKIELEECEIHWNQPATTIHNLVRAVSPEPGAWCTVTFKGEKKRLKIYRTRVIPLTHPQIPGTIFSQGKQEFIIACGQDALQILTLQLEGKKTMNAEDFMRGIKLSEIFTS